MPKKFQLPSDSEMLLLGFLFTREEISGTNLLSLSKDKLPEPTARVYLVRMKNRKMISSTHKGGKGRYYKIEELGRRMYLAKRAAEAILNAPSI